MTLSFDPLTAKSIEILLRSRSIHLWSIIIVCQKEMELMCGCGKKVFEVKIWPLTFWRKINRVPPRFKVNIYVKYHHNVKWKRSYGTKPLFHRRTDRWTDRQTAIVKPAYLHNFVGGGIQAYFQCDEIVEKWRPGGQKGMSLFHDIWFKI